MEGVAPLYSIVTYGDPRAIGDHIEWPHESVSINSDLHPHSISAIVVSLAQICSKN